MSFFNSINKFLGKVESAVQKFNGVVDSIKSIGQNVSSIANQVTGSSTNRPQPSPVTRESQPEPNPGVRLQLDPDPETKIPVVYGRAILGGKITDVRLIGNNLNLFVCMVLSFKTGPQLDGVPSQITIRRVFMDDQELLFDPTEVQGIGFLADRLRDSEGRNDTRVRDRIAMNFYVDGSGASTAPGNLELNPAIDPILRDARNIFPNWTANHFMSDMVFVTVQVAYTPEAGLDRFPEFRFEVDNTLTQPGDVLYDYLSSPVYGMGLTDAEIFKQ